jgi:hypothetical protein
VSLARRNARAGESDSANDSAAPRMICERMTPELPLDDRSDRERQVRARVPVGHRVHVQVVDPLPGSLDRAERTPRPVDELPSQTAFVTLPLFRQRVQTYARRATPSTSIRTRWRFGSKRRFVATIE